MSRFDPPDGSLRAGRMHLRAGPFVVAIAIAAAVVLSASFVGQIRTWIRTAFPGQFVLIAGALAAVLLIVALAAAAVRIRQRRLWRYSAIGAAIAVAVLYSAWNATDNAETNAVERFHFLEYGLITWLFYRAWRPLEDLSIFVLPALAGIIVGTAEEWLQWFIPVRVGELRDVFLNLAAIVAGLLFSVGVSPPAELTARFRASSFPRVVRLAAVAIVVLAGFFHSIHLGYRIVDVEIGSFLSRYSPERLPALQAAKAAQWKTDPPPLVLKRISREDQYLNEGLSHVRWRNRQWAAGDIDAAWRENRILEKYFAPVLDTPTYEGKQGHRWPSEQRADAEARAGARASAAYVSGAFPDIYTWPKTAFWTAALLPVVLLVVAARRHRPPASLHIPQNSPAED